MQDALKPCPFCGGSASLALCGFGTAKATCMDCGSEGTYSPSREEAIAAWNRRASDGAQPVAVRYRNNGGRWRYLNYPLTKGCTFPPTLGTPIYLYEGPAQVAPGAINNTGRGE